MRHENLCRILNEATIPTAVIAARIETITGVPAKDWVGQKERKS